MQESQASQSGPFEDEVAILIVDDNSVDRFMIKAACAQLSCRVDTAESGPEALEKFKQTRHRLVISDYIMEPMDGLELTTRLREIDPTVECILVSGSQSPEIMAYVQSNELSPVISKPITPNSLINRAVLSLERVRGRKDVLSGVAFSNRMDTCLPLIGLSPACLRLRKEVSELVHLTSPLLICGPVGSGKPQIATLLHQQGVYGHSLCLECFCGRNSPEELSRSLISADGKVGEMVKLTAYGTLIIHNIETLPLDLQRAFAEKFDEITAKVHLVVLSDFCLDQCLADGKIDEELYFELSLSVLNVPELKSRREDVPDVARFILGAPEQFGLVGDVSEADLEEFLSFLEPDGDYPMNLESVILELRKFAEGRPTVEVTR